MLFAGIGPDSEEDQGGRSIPRQREAVSLEWRHGRSIALLRRDESRAALGGHIRPFLRDQ